MLTGDLLYAIVFALLAALVLVPALMVQRGRATKVWWRPERRGDRPEIW